MKTSFVLTATAIALGAFSILPKVAHADDALESAAEGDAKPPASDKTPSEVEAESARLLRTWTITTGFRVSYVTSPGFDPFGTNDVLPTFEFDATRTLFVKGKLALAAGLSTSLGGQSAQARGAEGSLGVSRLGIPLEARYHARRWLYIDARVAPTLTLASARLKRLGAGEDLTDALVLPGADVSVGARFGIPLGPATSKPRLWLGTDIGYAVTTRESMELTRGEETPGVSESSVRLGELSLSGAFFRGHIGVSF